MPAHPPPSLDDILRAITRAMQRNALQWQTTADEDTFRAELGLGLVRITKVPETERYVLTLVDQDGVVLDEYQSSGPDCLEFEVLYREARRQALNLDSKLRHFYEHLKTLGGES